MSFGRDQCVGETEKLMDQFMAGEGDVDDFKSDLEGLGYSEQQIIDLLEEWGTKYAEEQQSLEEQHGDFLYEQWKERRYENDA